MIKVTLGEKPQQESKPFPKLMKGHLGTIIEVLNKPDAAGYADVVYRNDYLDDPYAKGFKLIGGR